MKKQKINLRSTRCDLNPFIPKPADRPRCSVKGCKKHRAIISTHADGTPLYRKVCHNHHSENIAKKHNVKSQQHLTAQRKGISVTAYRRRGYRKYLLEYCENIDSRLGFACTTTVFLDCGMLQVDHKDGNPGNNDVSNLQTLCSCCHAYKTHKFKDYASPGRKKLKKDKT